MAGEDLDPEQLKFLAVFVLFLGFACALVRSYRRENRSGAFIDTHVHLWDAEKLPPWLADPNLKQIAVTRSIQEYEAAAGANLTWAIYMEVDVPPDQREEEALRVCKLCSNPRNRLAGAVIGAPIVDGTVEEFGKYAQKWAAKAAALWAEAMVAVMAVGCMVAETAMGEVVAAGAVELTAAARAVHLEEATAVAVRAQAARRATRLLGR